MATKNKNYSKCYSENNFWKKLGSFAQKMGKEIVIKALQLYYAMSLNKATPSQITAIVAALGYLISPVDIVPDMLPGGFADDAGVLGLAVATISACSDPEVVAAAEKKANEWFS